MKPVVEPLIDQQEDAKTLYWRVNTSGNNDEVQTAHLRGKKGSGVNADISQEEMPIGV